MAVTSDSTYDVKLNIDGHDFSLDQIRELQTENQLCDTKFCIGATACAQIDVEMEKPDIQFSRMAKMILYIRRKYEDTFGEWQQKGIFYIDTRKDEADIVNRIHHISGYDGMLKTSKDYGDLGLTYPATTLDVVNKIAELSELEVNEDTKDVLNDGQTISKPEYLTGREILGYIAVMYGGSFMMDDYGKLKFVDMSETLGTAGGD